MLDHLFVSVSDVPRSVAFHDATLTPLGITQRHDYDGKVGPPRHPDLKGFGAAGRMFFWLRQGITQSQAVHIGFVADRSGAAGCTHSTVARPGSDHSRHAPARPPRPSRGATP